MYENVLVAVALDHSHHVNDALNVARTLAEEGAKITALHVIEEIPTYVVHQIPAELLSARKPAAEAELYAKLEGAADVQPVVILGHAGRSIIQFADESSVDCIVIASHKPELQDYFLGSTAQRVVRHAKCAVHVLR